MLPPSSEGRHIWAAGAPRKRVGLQPEGRAPAREGTEILDRNGVIVGRVTSADQDVEAAALAPGRFVAEAHSPIR